MASLLLALTLTQAPLRAQTCGSDYEIKQGDTLAQIAERVYGGASQWTIIFYANQDRLGANASLLVPGLSIRIPCVNASPPAERLPKEAVTPAQPPAGEARGEFVLSAMVKRIEFLTADGFSPFSDRSLRGGGMLTQVLTSAMDRIKDQSQGRFTYGMSWVNDWSAHLNPLLATRAFDVGFPWSRPACENFADLDQDGKYKCQRFFFSDPLYEVLTLVFVKSGSPIASASLEEMRGKTVCRPAGEGSYELNSGGKNWLKDNVVLLVKPQTVDECFRLLMAGAADAVAVTDLAGRAAIAGQGLAGRVEIIEKPVAIGTLHVVISKTHPNARTLLYYVNEALSKLKESGEYDKIVEQHLSVFWKTETGDERPAAPGAPAAPGGEAGSSGSVTPAAPPTGASSPANEKTPSTPSELANGQPRPGAASGRKDGP